MKSRQGTKPAESSASEKPLLFEQQEIDEEFLNKIEIGKSVFDVIFFRQAS
jgi:hypothetical protein